MDAVKELGDFKEFLRSVSKQLNAAGARTFDFSDDSGNSYRGWPYHSRDFKSTEDINPVPRATPIYRGGTWGDETHFLGTDGVLYEKVFHGEDALNLEDKIVTTLSNKISPIRIGNVIGTGKPFAQIRRQIDRMLLQFLADSEDYS